MAIRKIAKMGHPILRQKAKIVPVETISSAEVQQLIEDMLETVDDADGAGLAAPQIHDSRRIVVLRLDDEEEFRVWINPVLTPTTSAFALRFEGCLSVPGLRGAVARPNSIRVEGYERDGKPFAMELEGFSATVAQHECDHLDGILYMDRVESHTLAFMDEYLRYNPILMDQLLQDDE